MSRAGRMAGHLLAPSAAVTLFFVVAAIPVELLGCRMRGLLALAVAGPALLASLGSAILAVVGRAQGRRGTGWWIASALILAVPAVALLILA